MLNCLQFSSPVTPHSSQSNPRKRTSIVPAVRRNSKKAASGTANSVKGRFFFFFHAVIGHSHALGMANLENA